jgi:hypothetical protein
MYLALRCCCCGVLDAEELLDVLFCYQGKKVSTRCDFIVLLKLCSAHSLEAHKENFATRLSFVWVVYII